VNKSRTLGEFLWGGLAIGLACLSAFLILSPVCRWANKILLGGF
jgi:hypothetical protein